ncbi:MAG: tetratricopeptide repeat protein [Candidatus Omnitrophica bacterium]|nr:tetratricopeptide repeat protein [Candidatus Omnitrophota bacterium]
MPTILDRIKWPPARILFGLTLLAYFNAFANGFVLDDWAFIHDPGNLADLPVWDILSKSYHGFYRPFAFLILRTCVAIFGAAPVLYHLVNFTLYNVACYLVYRIVRTLAASEQAALITAVLYAVHPLHHPLVSNCFTLCLNVYLLSGLGSVWFFIRHLDKAGRKDAVLSTALFAAALLSHLSAIALPLVMIVIARYRIKMTIPTLIRHLWPYVLVVVAVAAVRLTAPGTRSLMSLLQANLSLPQYMAVLWDLLCWYHTQLLLPARTIFLWDQPLDTPHVWLKSFNLVVTMIGLVYLLNVRWRNTEKGLWLAIHCSGLLPLTVAAFIYSPRTGTAIIEPLWFVLSSIGFYALAAGGLLSLKGRIPARSFSGLVVGLTLALTFLTLGHNAKWHDERTYTRYWVAVNPLNSVPWKRWALTYLRTGETVSLMENLGGTDDQLRRRAHPLAWINRGHAYHLADRCTEAISDYTRALSLRPDHVDALLSRANCYAAIGNYTEARSDLSRILSENPDQAAALEDLAWLNAHTQSSD